ncbi:uncharacterized protein RJT21DRAFT_44324 [Scheffersomyces amazonensis]|uniref:uncharacterized protein n=1 Tax=Scheffersomyces amazonensis TaxID=1078765 RepID=UPI00315D6B04
MLSQTIRNSVGRVTSTRGYTAALIQSRFVSSKPPSCKDDSLLTPPGKLSQQRYGKSKAKGKSASNVQPVEGELGDVLKSKKSAGRSKSTKVKSIKSAVSANANTNSNTNTINGTGNSNPAASYIPYSQFPKPPASILSKSLQDLYTDMNLESLNDSITTDISNSTSKDNSETKIKQFEIPDKYLKSKMIEQITRKDRQIVDEIDSLLDMDNELEIAQSQLRIIKLYYDQDTESFQPIPEHPFRKSLSGMLNLNPAMDNIDDEYLWQLFPKNKLFGSLPSDPEQELKKKLEQETKAKQEQNDKEYLEWKKSLANSKSIYVKAGSRRKVDRKSARKFKKLEREGKLPKPQDFDDNDSKYGWD